RFSRDWSSDVCSSDLAIAACIDPSERLVAVGAGAALDLSNVIALAAGGATGLSIGAVAQQAARLRADHLLVDGVCDANVLDVLEIGRASCRGRGWRAR